MKFRTRGSLDTSQVSDRRGAGGGLGGLGGIGLGRGAAVGGGGIVGVILVVVLLLANGLGGGGGGTSASSFDGAGELSTNCQTGADANQRNDCRVVGVVNSVQEYWTGAVQGYTPAQTVLFDGQVVDRVRRRRLGGRAVLLPGATSRCTSTSGFYDELRTRFGAHGGPFAEAYVIAHEYGHHVQNLLGTNDRVGNDREGPTSASVRLELQADCYAGVWAAHAVDTALIEQVTDGRHQGRPRRRGRGGRRPHPAGRDRERRPRVVDARLVGAAPALVPRRATTPATRTAATRSPQTRSELAFPP